MSTHSILDKICVAIVICSLIVTALFVNGEALGITRIVDEDADQNSDSEYFTAKDQDGDWDTTDATVITLTGDGAEISGNGAYTNDGNVVITNAGWYVVSGTLTDGYLSVDAYDSSKVFLQLNGVEINCSDDACIRIDQADKVFLTLAEGSRNTLTSGSAYSDEALKDGTDGAIFAHDDLTINGNGSLAVTAGYRHGIAANDDLVITGGTITVTAAADAVHARDSLRIKEAVITVDAGDDGIATSNETENGYLYIESGTLNVTAGDDGIHTTGEITLAGGDLTISAGDDGIHSDTSVLISDGTILIGECYEGIEALIIDVSGGDITIYPRDDGFNANGNSENQIGAGGMGGGMDGSAHMGMTGGMPTPPDMSSMDSTGSRPAPPDMSSMDSTGSQPAPPDMSSMDSTGSQSTPPDMAFNEENSGSDTSAAAAAAAPDLTASDFSTANDEETYINISGGTITIINETGNDADGLDSNGDIRISGGTICVSLQGTGSNSALDYGSESGAVAEITGGTIIACGASSMAEAFDSSSTQASILYNTSTVAEAGTTLAIKDADGSVLLSWEVPCSFSSALVSCPQMETGGTYTVVIGENEEEITLEEVSASYGDAQSSVFGGNMNWGSMQRRGGMPDGDSFTGDNAAADSTDSAAVPSFTGENAAADRTDSAAVPSFTRENAAADRTDSAAVPSMDGIQDEMQSGMGGGPMQDRSREQTREEEEQTTADLQSTAKPVDAETWEILGGCLVLLFAGIAVVKIYKRQ